MTSTKTPLLEREKQILDRVKEKGSVSTQELAEILAVSTMTIHRDLKRLEDMGQIRKRHGGATQVSDESGKNLCAMCGKLVLGKNVFIIYLANNEQKTTCCAHCGLMLLTVTKGAWQSMTLDYLHGHMISANQAIYLIGADLNVCCVPTILSFGSRKEALRFQTGFGGELFSIDEAIQHLMGMQHNNQ